MKVDDRNLNGVSGLQSGRTSQAHESDRPGASSGPKISESAGGDRSEISSLAGNVSGAIAASSADRAGHIARLTQEYRAGNYSVNPRSISRAMIHDGLERKDGTR
jgi:anti-sigma28 factor (negative regulator of flagellin synthesis)